MSRDFSTLEQIAMALLIVAAFPFAILMFLTPKRLVCRNCGKAMTDGPTEAG